MLLPVTIVVQTVPSPDVTRDKGRHTDLICKECEPALGRTLVSTGLWAIHHRREHSFSQQQRHLFSALTAISIIFYRSS